MRFIKGINYDLEVKYLLGFNTKRNISKKQLKKEIISIKRELRCNTIKFNSSDLKLLMEASKIALKEGLIVWACPRFIGKDTKEAKGMLIKTAKELERIRKDHNNLVYVTGAEISLDFHGLFNNKENKEKFEEFYDYIKARNIYKILLKRKQLNHKYFKITEHTVKTFSNRVNGFLKNTVKEIRKQFKGKITYCAGEWEDINWSIFDIIGPQMYINKWNKNRIMDEIKDLKKYNKSIIPSEYGSATYKGCLNYGASAGCESFFNKKNTRSEEEQVINIKKHIDLFKKLKLNGYLLFTYVEPPWDRSKPTTCDKTSFGIMRWITDQKLKPKKAFYAIAKEYGNSNN